MRIRARRTANPARVTGTLQTGTRKPGNEIKQRWDQDHGQGQRGIVGRIARQPRQNQTRQERRKGEEQRLWTAQEHPIFKSRHGFRDG